MGNDSRAGGFFLQIGQRPHRVPFVARFSSRLWSRGELKLITVFRTSRLVTEQSFRWRGIRQLSDCYLLAYNT
jgi:hypothetical protein